MNTYRSRRVRTGILAATVIIFAMAGCQLAPRAGNPASSAVVASVSDVSASSETSLLSTQGDAGAAAPAPTPVAIATPITTAGNFATAVRDVAQMVKPAVVQITNQQVQFDQYNQAYNVPAGVGSGVIYDNQGHILTNNHVVEGAEKLLVSLPDGRSMPAKLIGGDSQTDLAVLQVSGSNLPLAQLGDSAQLQVGDWVVAIGNALALPGGPTVTAGVVSALGRDVQEPGDQGGTGPFLFDVIQTSAPINPGNSGGPLLNLAGQVVGINTLVAGQAEPGVAAQGIGFAISIAAAKPIADQLVATGHVVHTYLGINYVPMNPALASRFGIATDTNGVAVAQVAPGSPAAQAGLQRRDVITAVDGKALQSDSGLQQVLATHKPGDKLALTVLRGTDKLDVQLTLAERPNNLGQANPDNLANS